MAVISQSVQSRKNIFSGLRLLRSEFFLVSVFIFSLIAPGLILAEEKENPEVYPATEERAQNSVSSKVQSKLLRAQNFTDSELASEGKDKNSSPALSPGVGFSDWIRMLLSLLFIVGLIFILAWLVRKFNGGVLPANQDIKVLSSVSLSHKEKLITVQVEDQRLLLAVSPSGINKLTTLSGSPNEGSKSDYS